MTEEYQLDLFGLVLDRVKKHKGYTVIGILKDAPLGVRIRGSIQTIQTNNLT